MSTTIGASGTTGSSGGITQSTRQGQSGTPGITGDFNTFLTLLTTQLRNQDPTNAMDVNKMTEQLVSFAGVEQQIQMNRQLQEMVGLQQGAQLTAAAGLIGRTLEISSSTLPLQNGQAAVRLPPAGAARAAQVTVADAAGRPLRTATVALDAGTSTWRWDGRDNAGRLLPDGAYALDVQGRDALGGNVALTSTVLARATGAERAGQGVALRFGAVSLGIDRLRGLEP